MPRSGVQIKHLHGAGSWDGSLRLRIRLTWLPMLGCLPLLGACQPPHPPGQLVVASRSSLESVDPVDVTTFAGTQLLSALGDPL